MADAFVAQVDNVHKHIWTYTRIVRMNVYCYKNIVLTKVSTVPINSLYFDIF